jgi:hypothetical protein
VVRPKPSRSASQPGANILGTLPRWLMLSLSRGQSRVPSWDGLEGILTSRQLWAVDFRKQKTDENEFRHAGAAILSICDTMGKAPALAADEVFFFNRLAEIWQENAIADIGSRGAVPRLLLR